MKVLPFIIPKPERGGLIYQVDKVNLFYDKLHQHEEIQLSFILEGNGTLVVGDTINNFTKGEVLVIGSNIPHVFKSDKSSQESHMLTLFFTEHSFGESFFNLEELKDIQTFFERSKYGFRPQSHIEEMKNLFLKLEKASKLNRFIISLQLLNCMVKSDYTSLSSFVYDKKYSLVEGDRMRNVFEFTLNNYSEEISLDTVSKVANMTKNAFCKYFKKRTNKTYIQFLNEFRIEKASKLLKEKSDYSIAEIAYMSGFRNISNFNRVFKKLKGETPSKFK
ncbi:AraC family transcriptional regulator [Winogradskyella sp. PG-2]|uniref:AraC family transcriptional regulator n=1 Tax=Winogradskyella sp. PG-2 TaxID=754409 RepID=UPI0004587EBA|nr:helix-turn-helix domain-containing protein [Winogradskyella sp. PG-2]BAO76076.1 transcriptional regulator [Winogradskyella sp. PG-2]